jgi:hypothetical protein
MIVAIKFITFVIIIWMTINFSRNPVNAWLPFSTEVNGAWSYTRTSVPLSLREVSLNSFSTWRKNIKRCIIWNVHPDIFFPQNLESITNLDIWAFIGLNYFPSGTSVDKTVVFCLKILRRDSPEETEEYRKSLSQNTILLECCWY